jgi:demethylmenaquinone methyltransferase/2-methoxy-6-polyprenyl-1,4-benzoquinol methylase
MFGRIARRYDTGNRVLSLGRDQAWRRKAVALLAPAAHETVLDLGAGTADLALELSKYAGRVVAIDLSQPMLAIGKRKTWDAGREGLIMFIVSDALRLPFPDASFDGVASAFTVRNLARLEDGFREVHRVLKPGGRMLSLEFSKPSSRVINLLYRPYLNKILPFVGGRISGDRHAYRYLAESIGDFPGAEELADCIRAAGLGQVEYHMMNLGTVAAHLGRKPPALAEPAGGIS